MTYQVTPKNPKELSKKQKHNVKVPTGDNLFCFLSPVYLYLYQYTPCISITYNVFSSPSNLHSISRFPIPNTRFFFFDFSHAHAICVKSKSKSKNSILYSFVNIFLSKIPICLSYTYSILPDPCSKFFQKVFPISQESWLTNYIDRPFLVSKILEVVVFSGFSTPYQ